MAKDEKDIHHEGPSTPLDYAASLPRMSAAEKPPKPSALLRPLTGWVLVVILLLVVLFFVFLNSIAIRWPDAPKSL